MDISSKSKNLNGCDEAAEDIEDDNEGVENEGVENEGVENEGVVMGTLLPELTFSKDGSFIMVGKWIFCLSLVSAWWSFLVLLAISL
ncbi:hypothetical protein WICMUC_003420 [Wickerhamomyces mucosus]|uniref:Transmembrane protein n=1 Tax=Wickerhamomyces mucosus TaxID=1378264 RepID=A0A9P8TC90_9ASCO|nr:hypothetical protein WICMUC_003420 [Wickerhamomyces mucosus]